MAAKGTSRIQHTVWIIWWDYNNKKIPCFDTPFTLSGLMPLHNIQGRSLHSIGFQLKARGHLRKDDCPHQHPHKIHKLESMSFLGKFGIGSMNLRRRKPRRCFPLTLGPLDPGSLGNDGEVGLPCPPLSHFTRLFSSPDCTQISEQCSVLYCELCPWLRWTTWWEDLILREVAEDMIMSLSETVTPEFDTIMCLSTTKVGMQLFVKLLENL